MGKFARVLAIDLGASSGRGIVFECDGERIREQTVHRFANGAIECDGRLYWDLDALLRETVQAIRLADRTCGKLDSVGIDTWGVDFGLIGRDGMPIGNPRHYRDKAHASTRARLQDRAAELFRIAGICDNDFNTTYQLIARKREGTDFTAVRHLLFMPQLLGYLLTGKAATEPTIASTSGLYTRAGGFDETFCAALGIPTHIFPETVETSSAIGCVKPEIAAQIGIAYDLPVIATAGHDTACAVLGTPSSDAYPLFLSSGTWSLFGAIEERAILRDEARDARYTNELAFDGKVRFLRNIMGMWIIQECRRQWNAQGMDLDYPQIADMARQARDCGARIDPDDPAFAFPCEMADAVSEYVLAHQGIALQGIGAIARCVYESLADAYGRAYLELCRLTGRTYDRLYIVGGGSNNDDLNARIADCLRIPVSAGPAEASALGNALGQLVGLGAIERSQIKRLVTQNYEVKVFLPREHCD